MVLKEFFVTLKGGVALYHGRYHQTADQAGAESQLISGFISAISTFASRVFGEDVREINFSNSKLVIQEVSNLIFVCVTGLEIPLALTVDLQRQVGEKIAELIQSYDPIRDLPIVKKSINQLVEEENFVKRFSLPVKTGVEEVGQVDLSDEGELSRIVFIGIAKAGKSSIVEAFFNRKQQEELRHIPPTMGLKSLVKKNPFTSEGPPFQVLDLGGHTQFLDNHLRSETLFANTMNLIFVVDSQSPAELVQAIEYFSKVLDIIGRSKSPPIISIFLHKADPKGAPIPTAVFWELTQSLFTKLSSMNLNWAVYQTSIFDQTSLDAAMVESFLRALPEEYINQTMALGDFLAAFDSLLPMTLDGSSPSANGGVSSEMEKRVFGAAVQMGKEFGRKIRGKWVEFVIRGRRMNPLDEDNVGAFAHIDRVGRDLKFTVSWPLPGQISDSPYFPTVFQGILTGILSYCGSYRVERECQSFGDQFLCEFWGKRS